MDETVSDPAQPARRFAHAPRAVVLGAEVPVAGGPILRALGLAWLDLRDAGTGLWIPRCRSIHTFGMRFGLEVVFLDSAGRELSRLRRLGPGRIASCAGASSVLELTGEHLDDSRGG